jgi:DNA polymerase IIIc chi subunit
MCENRFEEFPMEKIQNVTLAIPKDVLRKAKIMAINRNTSLSNLLTQTLVELVSNQEAYEAAKQRNQAMLERGFNLGTRGKTNWKREELHER